MWCFMMVKSQLTKYHRHVHCMMHGLPTDENSSGHIESLPVPQRKTFFPWCNSTIHPILPGRKSEAGQRFLCICANHMRLLQSMMFILLEFHFYCGSIGSSNGLPSFYLLSCMNKLKLWSAAGVEASIVSTEKKAIYTVSKSFSSHL